MVGSSPIGAVCVYGPQEDRCDGAEALTRWLRSSGGLYGTRVIPADFTGELTAGMPVVRLSVLTERKTESIGLPMTISTSLSSPNGMLKVTADRGRLQRGGLGWQDGEMDGLCEISMKKQKPHEPK